MRKGERERGWMSDVRDILLNDWNPIGFPVPPDEYDAYIGGIVHLLRTGADHRKLEDKLSRVERVSMGLPGDRSRCDAAARKLVGLIWAAEASINHAGRGNKKAARRRVSAVRLGGGGNEALGEERR